MRTDLRRLIAGAVALTLALIALAVPASAVSSPAVSAGAVVPAAELLSELRVDEFSMAPYDPAVFGDATDVDEDGCRLLPRVLIRDSTVPPLVTDGCSAVSGEWVSRWTGATITDPTVLAVDQLVPLKEAWVSGAYDWTFEERRAFANDVGDSRTVVLLESALKAQRIGTDFSSWTPENCQLVADFIAVKWRWNLAVDPTERIFIERNLDRCPRLTVNVPEIPADQPDDPPPAARYFLTDYDGTIWQVTSAAIRALSYTEWRDLGSPAPRQSPTEYVRYPWSTSVSAVTIFGQPRDRWVWKHVSFEEWSRAGKQAPRFAGWIQDSTFYKWESSRQIFVKDAGGVTHALTGQEWADSGWEPYALQTNQGFVKLSWDASIAFLSDYAAGKGAPITYNRWLAEGFPAPAVSERFAGDQIYQNYGSPTVFYAGPTVNRAISFAEWSALGYPTPTVYGAPAPSAKGDGDGRFTVATYPDTQQEVWDTGRFLARSTWLVSQRDVLDLRFVAHTGDVVNWDTDSHDQYVIAEAAMDPLEIAGVPYQLSIGNHDTLATGPGGGARDPKRTREYQRTTTTFNQFFRPTDYSALAGVFEEGKVDNTYSTFQAEGATWLVLNLELWPRIAAVDWAEGVISSHPDANVIIQTHSFLNSAADIDGAGQSSTRWSYGDSSPQYIYDRLVGPHANVKVVMSGHVGTAASKVVTTATGNHVAYLVQALHSNTNNPVRLSEIDVDSGTISTMVYAPSDGATWDARTLSGLTFITG